MSSTSQVTTFSDKTCGMCHSTKPVQSFYKNQSRCKDCQRSVLKTYKRKLIPSERLREINYLKVHGITVADYDFLLQKQNGRCAICQSDKTGGPKHFTVDHDHKTGEIRGLLCRPCNMGLGLFNDSFGNLMAAADYLYYSKGL